jgi:hypothetical protein
MGEWGRVFSCSQAGLGNAISAKLSLATIFFPKYNLGTRVKAVDPEEFSQSQPLVIAPRGAVDRKERRTLAAFGVFQGTGRGLPHLGGLGQTFC